MINNRIYADFLKFLWTGFEWIIRLYHSKLNVESQHPRTRLPRPPSDSWCSLPPDVSLERAHEGMCCYSFFVAICKVSVGGKNIFS